MTLKQTFDEISREVELLLTLSEQLKQDCSLTMKTHEALTQAEHDLINQIVHCANDASHCLELVQNRLQRLA